MSWMGVNIPPPFVRSSYGTKQVNGFTFCITLCITSLHFFLTPKAAYNPTHEQQWSNQSVESFDLNTAMIVTKKITDYLFSNVQQSWYEKFPHIYLNYFRMATLDWRGSKTPITPIWTVFGLPQPTWRVSFYQKWYSLPLRLS